MARYSVITAFPELIKSYVSTSIIGRGVERGLLDVEIIDLRHFGEGEYRRIDDYAFGRGGMVLMAEPLKRALDHASSSGECYVVSTSPQGVPLHQELVEDLHRISNEKKLVIICGHYEGIDERFTERYVDKEVSLGDFVLTGGELPALAIIDSSSRLVPGVVGREAAVSNDSFVTGMLDHPHYTRPAAWEDVTVPEVLTSGDDQMILRYRRDVAVKRSIERRPDTIARASIIPYLYHGVYVMLMHSGVVDKNGEQAVTSITGMDVHDISRACRTFGAKKFLIVTPMEAQRNIIKDIASHWKEGGGAVHNPDRRDAMELVKTFASLNTALSWIEKREREKPFLIATSAKENASARNWLTLKTEMLKLSRPIVLVFGTGGGLSSDLISRCDALASPIRGTDEYDHLSVRSAASIFLDRFFGLR